MKANDRIFIPRAKAIVKINVSRKQFVAVWSLMPVEMTNK